MNPPVAHKKPHSRSLHTEIVDDPWFWLNDRSDPEVIAHIEAENIYTSTVMEPTAELQETIFSEIKDRTLETDLSVPAQKGDYWYTARTEEGKAYAIRVRLAGSPDGASELVLDENAEAEGNEYFRLGNFSVSSDHRFLAYSTDTTGAESYTTRIREITTQKELSDVLTECRYGLAWSKDGAHLFYTVADETLRPFQIWRHKIGTNQSGDVLVLHEDDDRYYLDLGKTRSGDYIVITADSAVTESAWVIPADDAVTDPRPVLPRVEGVQYSIDHRDDVFWIIINDEGADGRLVTIPVDGGELSEVVEHSSGRKLERPMCFADHVLVWGRADGLPAVFVLGDGVLTPIEFDEPLYEVMPDANHEFSASKIRYAFESLVTPLSIYDHDLVTGERTLLKQTPVLGGFNPTDYVQERYWARARDGAMVPISYVRHIDTPLDGSAALVLYAYGAYELSVPLRFSIARLSLLDRGIGYAIAHVRGGGELGKAWYETGKLADKANTFCDFVDAAEYLADAGVCSASRIAARGASAGGLTVGAALNLAPSTFAAIVAEVPFVDVVNTMLDPDLPLTVVEWEEWGNPRVAEEYAWIRAYAPYENVGRVDHPPILVTAGLNDPRVSYWEPAKWVQLLRELSTSDTGVLLKTEMTAGHFARSGRYDLWRDEAVVLAFLLTRLGVPGAA
ncbi:MAG: oligopeptidase B [Acidimicrobiia bacterium]|nr:MAG: oligopeptidase B [Acidimicrobiia bacterium]